jgi:hypothetical protein
VTSQPDYGWGPGSETDIQSFPVPEWIGQGAGGESFPDGDNDTDDLGSYRALGPLLPPRCSPPASVGTIPSVPYMMGMGGEG